jgi:hypothetical protein
VISPVAWDVNERHRGGQACGDDDKDDLEELAHVGLGQLTVTLPARADDTGVGAYFLPVLAGLGRLLESLDPVLMHLQYAQQ